MPSLNIKQFIESIDVFGLSITACQTLAGDLNNSNRVNESAFGQFNLALHVNDDERSVLENRHALQTNFYVNHHIQWLEQVHSADVVVIDDVITTPLKADAMVCREQNIALAIMTADCLPILISNSQGNEIAAIHAGWRPLAGNIIENTLAKMHSKPNELIAWLGPCISQQHFEVGREVVDTFIELNYEFEVYFEQTGKDKWHGDLSAIALKQLSSLGIKTIYQDNRCTFANDKLYSYRKNKVTGRMSSIIGIC